MTRSPLSTSSCTSFACQDRASPTLALSIGSSRHRLSGAVQLLLDDERSPSVAGIGINYLRCFSATPLSPASNTRMR